MAPFGAERPALQERAVTSAQASETGFSAAGLTARNYATVRDPRTATRLARIRTTSSSGTIVRGRESLAARHHGHVHCRAQQRQLARVRTRVTDAVLQEFAACGGVGHEADQSDAPQLGSGEVGPQAGHIGYLDEIIGAIAKVEGCRGAGRRECRRRKVTRRERDLQRRVLVQLPSWQGLVCGFAVATSSTL